MQRTHLRSHQNILKRHLIHVGAFNLSSILWNTGTPRECGEIGVACFVALLLYRASQAGIGPARVELQRTV